MQITNVTLIAWFNLDYLDRLERDIVSVMQIMEEKKSTGLTKEDVSILLDRDCCLFSWF